MGMGWNDEITFCFGVEHLFLSPTDRLCSSRPVNSFAKTSNLNFKGNWQIHEVRHVHFEFQIQFWCAQNRPVRRRQCGKPLRFHVSKRLVNELLLERCGDRFSLSAKLRRLANSELRVGIANAPHAVLWDSKVADHPTNVIEISFEQCKVDCPKFNFIAKIHRNSPVLKRKSNKNSSSISTMFSGGKLTLIPSGWPAYFETTFVMSCRAKHVDMLKLKSWNICSCGIALPAA